MSKLKELARFFGLSVLTTVVIAAAFLGFRAQIKEKIQQATYRQLTESAQQQADGLRRYIAIVTSQLEALAKFSADPAHRANMVSFHTELYGGAGMSWLAYADLGGTITSGPYKGITLRTRVGSCFPPADKTRWTSIILTGKTRRNPSFLPCRSWSTRLWTRC